MAYHLACTGAVHWNRIATVQGFGLLLRQHAREDAMPATLPNARMPGKWSHPMPVARVVSTHLAKRVWPR